MLKILYTNVRGYLLADIAAELTLLPVDFATVALLQTEVNFAAGEWTYLRLSNGVYSEDVKITGTSGTYLIAERGVSGSTPRGFDDLDTVVTDSVGIAAIQDIVAASPAPSGMVIDTRGLIYNSSSDPNRPMLEVDPPNIIGDSSIEVLGSWPNVQITFRQDAGGCCPGEATGGTAAEGGITTVNLVSTILQGSVIGNTLNLNLQTPTFQGAGSVAVSGSWPNYTITGAAGVGGGSVTSVSVGPGLTLSGNPAVNPQISITNTGVTAGDYAGLVVNARGQITQIPAGFNPVSSIVVPDGATVSRAGGVVTIAFDDADVGVKGLVALADETAPLNSTDTSTAVSPALLHSVLNGGGSRNAVAGSGTGEADASYTNILSATAIPVVLAAGETAILMGDVQVLDNATPLTPVAFGVGVFDASNTMRYASKISTQSKQNILGKLVGPLNTTISMVTTALPANSTLHSAHLAMVKV